MRQNVVTADFAARFNFATGRHCPMEKSIKAGYPVAVCKWLYVFQERGETSDDLSLI